MILPALQVLLTYPSSKTFSQSCEALSGQRDQHDVGILGNKLLQNPDEVVIVAGSKFGVLGEGQQGVQGLFSRLPLLLFNLRQKIIRLYLKQRLVLRKLGTYNFQKERYGNEVTHSSPNGPI